MLVIMVSGLVVTAKNGQNIKVENLKPVEEFKQLELLNRFGFNLGWYTFGKNIHVILKQVENAEMQIYLGEELIEAQSILNQLLNDLVKDFNVNPAVEKEIFTLLKEHGCCYF